MRTAEEYVASVLERMPHGVPNRDQIAMELRAHIAERTANGTPLADVLAQLGDPERLAESYVSAIPLIPVSFATRASAKILDAAMFVVPITALAFILAPRSAGSRLIIVCIVLLACPLFMLYTIFWESHFDTTMGKRMLGVRVVREAGTRISAGQAIVRQLPWLLQIFWIDAFFALFTERHQRAFELLSKTRVVVDQSLETAS
jgi:uncharacterized RDD family membrane protein YckC